MSPPRAVSRIVIGSVGHAACDRICPCAVGDATVRSGGSRCCTVTLRRSTSADATRAIGGRCSASSAWSSRSPRIGECPFHDDLPRLDLFEARARPTPQCHSSVKTRAGPIFDGTMLQDAGARLLAGALGCHGANDALARTGLDLRVPYRRESRKFQIMVDSKTKVLRPTSIARFSLKFES